MNKEKQQRDPRDEADHRMLRLKLAATIADLAVDVVRLVLRR